MNGQLPAKGDFNQLYNNNSQVFLSASKKRKVEEPVDMPGELLLRGRSFLPVRSGSSVFTTEEWKSSGTSLFTPVKHDLYINIQKYDQITAAQGSFFTADESGNFSHSVVGNVLHFWRYDKQTRRQFIAQSLLFTEQQEYLRVQAFLRDV